MNKRRRETGTIQFADYRETLGIELVYGQQIAHTFSRHTHRTLGLGLVEQGIRVYTCRGETYEVTAGQVFIIPPHEEHCCQAADGPHTYRLLLVADALLQESGLAENVKHYTFSRLVLDDADLYRQLQELAADLDTEESILAKKSLVLALVGRLFETYAEGTVCKTADCSQRETVEKVQRFMEDNYAASFSLEELAQYAHCSPYHLLRQFSRLTGIPPHVYQQQVRIRQAKQLLAQGCSLLETAMYTGFADQSHFARVFKKLMGVTPGDYRTSLGLRK